MKTYLLTLEILKGKHSQKDMRMSFDAENDDKAREFAKATSELKTYNGKPVEFGGYAIYRRLSLGFAALWVKVRNTA